MTDYSLLLVTSLTTFLYIITSYTNWSLFHIWPTPIQCTEKEDLVFLKVHKTGSSTIANILQRFGYFRGLNFALPKKTPGQIRYNYFGEVGETLRPDDIIPSKSDSKKYNILYNHVIFSWKPFMKMFPKNTVMYVTMLRDPVHQFISALSFFLHEKILHAARENITTYLENPGAFEQEESPYLSFTNNRQALDLGLEPSKVRDRNYVTKYVTVLDKIFDLVLIMEYFDESLILLKRRMCWTFKDILYMRKNAAYQSFDFRLNTKDRILLRNWSLADHMIYDHYYRKFHEDLERESNIVEETHHYKTILVHTEMFCNGSESGNNLIIGRSSWNQPFRVTALDCAYMMMGELKFLNKLLHDKV